MRAHIFLTLVLLNLSACSQNKKQSTTINSVKDSKDIDTIISLDKGVSIYASKGEFYPDSHYSFTTYQSIKIVVNKKMVFADTATLTEFEFDHNLHPFYRKLEGNKYEFLIGINDRPNLDFFLHLITNTNGVIKRDSIPASIMESKKTIGKDGLIEVSGFRDDSQDWGDSANLMTPYNPLLFYKYKKDGIILDSVKTIEVNTEVFGKFEGYEYNEKIPYKEKDIDKKWRALNIISPN